MRPLDQLTREHIRQYQLHLTQERPVTWITYFKQGVCTLHLFFYREVLKTDWEVRHIPYQKTGRKRQRPTLTAKLTQKKTGIEFCINIDRAVIDAPAGISTEDCVDGETAFLTTAFKLTCDDTDVEFEQSGVARPDAHVSARFPKPPHAVSTRREAHRRI